MAQTEFTVQDATSLVEKITAFADTLTPGELGAWQAIEQQISTLAADETDDVSGFMIAPDSAGAMAEAHQQELRNEARHSRTGRTTEQRRTLWNRLVSRT